MKKVASAVLVLFLSLSGCGPGGIIDIPLPGQTPTIHTFEVSPLTISAGESATLTWKVDNANTVEIDHGIGSVALTGSRTVTPETTTVYTLVAASPTGKTVSATTQVTVEGALSPPVITSFLANPPVISPGDSATLTWSVEGADSVAIAPGIGSAASSGSVAVSPDEETTYTLTATNSAGSASSTTVVAVSGSSPTGPPVINSFYADPATIYPGDFTTLRWDVSGATSVSMDRGIGTVPSVGTRAVSVLATTNYTLTASNSYGTVALTVPVLVSPVPDDAEPDLVITTIAKVATPTGYVIGYTARNQGDVNCPSTVAKLYVNGVYKGSDSVPSMAPDESVSGQFTAWTHDPAMPVVTVVADADDEVSESDESNNEKSVSIAVETVVDLIDKAHLAEWTTGSPPTEISFGGSTGDPNGFVVLRTSAQLEDGDSHPEVLETHPKWVNGGWVQGFYPEFTVPLGARFFADVGFMNGAGGSDGVIFRVFFWQTGDDIPNVLGTIDSEYDGDLDRFNLNMADYVGRTGSIGIQVLAGSSSAQDWAVWVDAKVVR